jgi:hypothetical protein
MGGRQVRIRTLGFGALVPVIALALAIPAAPASAARHVAGLQLSQRIVNFGEVPVGAPGCTRVNGVLVGCEVRVVTLTNVGSEVIQFESFSTCSKVFRSFGSCSGSGPSWGGTAGYDSDCGGNLDHWALDPGESCQLTLFAVPSDAGRIQGYEIAVVRVGPEPLDLDYAVIRVTVHGV